MSAMCTVAFFAFLRIWELTASRGNTTNIINVSQLHRLVDAQGQIQALPPGSEEFRVNKCITYLVSP